MSKKECGRAAFSWALVIFISFLAKQALAIDIQITTLEGSSNIEFGDIENITSEGLPIKAKTSKEVRLLITNAGSTRYAVSQIFQTPPLSDKGTLFDTELVRSYAQLRQGQGEIKIPQPVPFQGGEQEIFISDNNNPTAEIVLFYTLEVPPSQEAGHYHTAITYKVSTL